MRTLIAAVLSLALWAGTAHAQTQKRFFQEPHGTGGAVSTDVLPIERVNPMAPLGYQTEYLEPGDLLNFMSQMPTVGSMTSSDMLPCVTSTSTFLCSLSQVESILAGTTTGKLVDAGTLSQQSSAAPGSGAVLRTFSARNGDVLRLQDYGALCNGTSGTQDQAAWNAAYALIPSSGGEIHIPAGTGCVLGNITTTMPITIVGDGGPYGQATIIPSSITASVFDIEGSFSEVRDLAFTTSNPSTIKQTSGSLISVESGAARFRASNITMTEFHEGITLKGMSTADLRGIRAFLYSTGVSTSTAAIRITGGLDVKIDGMTAAGPPSSPQSTAGIQIDNAGDVTIDNADVISMGTDLLVDPGTGQSVTSLWGSNSFFDTATRGIDLCPTGSGVIERSRFTGYWASSHTAGGVRVCSTGTVDGVDFIDGHEFLNTGYGIDLEGGQRIHILSGQIAQNSSDGLHVAAGVSTWSFEGVSDGTSSGLTGNGGYAVNVVGGPSDDYIIRGNLVAGNTLGAISDNGTGTHKSVYGNPGDPNDYEIYRDNATGFLSLSGSQSGFSGYRFLGNGGTPLGQIDNSGNLTAKGAVLGSVGTYAAAGTTQGTATSVSTQNVLVTTGTGGIVLGAYGVGTLPIAIGNFSGGPVLVYPPSGSNFLGFSTNAPVVLQNGSIFAVAPETSTTWSVNGGGIIPFGTPASSSAPCTQGQKMLDASWDYDCVGTNSWKHVSNGTTF